MAWTSSADVLGAWIGEDAPSDAALVDTWVGKAERLLRAKVPTLAVRVAADPVTEPDLLGNVKDIVTAMVQRVFRNPEGIRQRQETTGPFTGSVTYGGDQPGALFVTDAELSTLSSSGSTRVAFTVDTIPFASPFSPHYVQPEGGW
jgi:hypothetical protein